MDNDRLIHSIAVARKMVEIAKEKNMKITNISLDKSLLENDESFYKLVDMLYAYFELGGVSVCANLPYYITTPILMKLLESGLPFDYITVMVQNEVAARLAAKPGSSDYGAITAILGYYGTVKKLFKVPAGCFIPAPKVDSAVVRIDLYKEPLYTPKDEKLFRNLIKFAFEMRRKTLQNAICAKLPYSKDIVLEAIRAIGHPDTVRGERLSTEDFVKLADELSK